MKPPGRPARAGEAQSDRFDFMVQARLRVAGDLHHGRLPDGAVYIGRQTPTLQASPYANPYKASYYGRDGALALYSQYLDDRPELVERARRELAGKAIACWCKPTDRCHGDELAERIAEQPVPPHSWRSAGRGMRSCRMCGMDEESRSLGSSFAPVRIYQRKGRRAVAARMPACGAELPAPPADARAAFWQAATDARTALARGEYGEAFRLLATARTYKPDNPNLDRYERQIRDAAAQPSREAQ